MITVVGAGLSGLIAANLLAAGGYPFRVYEKQDALPDNHHSVLRFRSPALGEALGIPFRKVQTINALACPPDNALKASLAYSQATTGTGRTDRSIARVVDGPKVWERWIAPEDFRERLLCRVRDRITTNTTVKFRPVPEWQDPERIISTVPMQHMPLNGAAPHVFPSIPQIVVTGVLSAVDAYGSLYNPAPSFKSAWTRISVTGNRVAVEISKALLGEPSLPCSVAFAASVSHLGTGISEPKVWQSDNARILPINERWRKAFIMHLTDNYGVYSFGRFATWRPGLLLDDLLGDFRVITQMMDGERKAQYEARKGAHE